MNPFAFVNLSKEHWNSPRCARKQLMFDALLRQPEVEEVLYVDAHRYRWQHPSDTTSAIPGMHVWQGKFLLPGERLRFVRLINRWYIYRVLHKELDHRTRWYSIFYNPWDVPLARYLLTHGGVFFDWTEDWVKYYDNPAIRSAQDEAVMMASGVIAVTERLSDRATELRGTKKNVLLLPNATAWKPGHSLPCPEDITHIPVPRIGYVGHLGPWFDTDLVLKLAHLRLNWHWVMIGHVDQHISERFRDCDNVHLLGQRPFYTLQAYMAHCQVLVAPYRKNIEGDSTKLYDYLTLGLPIVSAEISTASRLQTHVRMVSGLQSWLQALDEALKEEDTVVRRARQQESLKHTWDVRATALLDWLKEFDNA